MCVQAVKSFINGWHQLDKGSLALSLLQDRFQGLLNVMIHQEEQEMEQVSLHTLPKDCIHSNWVKIFFQL